MIKKCWRVLHIPQSVVSFKCEDNTVIITSTRTWFSDTTCEPDCENLESIHTWIKHERWFLVEVVSHLIARIITRQQTSFIQSLPLFLGKALYLIWIPRNTQAVQSSGHTVPVSDWMLQLYVTTWHKSNTPHWGPDLYLQSDAFLYRSFMHLLEKINCCFPEITRPPSQSWEKLSNFHETWWHIMSMYHHDAELWEKVSFFHKNFAHKSEIIILLIQKNWEKHIFLLRWMHYASVHLMWGT